MVYIRRRWVLKVKKKLIEVLRIRKWLIKNSINNYISEVQFLMLNGEDVDIRSIVKRFIKKEGDSTKLMVNELRHNKYFTPLMFAVTKENMDLVKEEIEKCDVNKIDNRGYTALMYACRFNESADIVRILLDKEANIYARSFDGKNALDFANDSGNSEIIAILGEKIRKRDCDFVVNISEYSKVRCSQLSTSCYRTH